MNKKILMLLVILTVSVSVIVGCSKVTRQEDSETSVSIILSEVTEDEPIPSDSDKDAVDEDASEVIGKVEEIKDFMFIITDDDNVSYAFTFEDKPEDLDKIWYVSSGATQCSIYAATLTLFENKNRISSSSYSACTRYHTDGVIVMFFSNMVLSKLTKARTRYKKGEICSEEFNSILEQ